MKRVYSKLTILAVICFLSFQIGCEKQESKVAAAKPSELTTGPAKKSQAASESGQGAPHISFEKTTHDFGEIASAATNVCEFKFTNTGNNVLKVGKIQSTCGCTVPKLSKEEYAPGESGTVEVKYNSGRHPGSATKHLYVSSNDETNPKVELTLKAMVMMKVDYEPKVLSFLLKDVNSGVPEIKIRSSDGQQFAIRGFKSNANCITADYDPAVKNTEFVIKPKVNLEKLRTDATGRIDISLTHPGCDMVSIPFRALSRFGINPPRIVVFEASPQKPVTKDLWVLNNYGEDFEIESTSSKKGTIKVLKQEKVGNRYNFELEITPPEIMTESKKKIFEDVFFMNIKGGEKLEVACTVFYRRLLKGDGKPAEKPTK